MATKDKLKELLADKYGKDKKDLEDSTLIREIVGGDKNLAGYIKEEFQVELSSSELESASNINDLAALL